MEDVQNQNVVLTKEQFDKLMERIEQLETKKEEDVVSRIERLEKRDALSGRLDKLEQIKPDQTPPTFSGGNMGLSVPYNPPAKKKDSGWATVGKIAIGAGLTGIAWAICSAIGGSSGGGNTFGGDMPN
jgi:hypothetical protein